MSIFNDLEFKRLKENYFKIFDKKSDIIAREVEIDFNSENKIQSNLFSQKISSKTGFRILIDKILSSKNVSVDFYTSEDASFFSFCLNSSICYYIEFDLKNIYDNLKELEEIFECSTLKIVYDHKKLVNILKSNNISYGNIYEIIILQN